ncbi:hypothetical protein JCM1841_002800 [Sporobolomyces salmonicolor]
MQNETDLYNNTYTTLDFIIGLLITIAASLANALGLNITKLDFTRQEALPPAERRPDYLRPFWLLGIILYIGSQVLGSTLALEFLRAEYVAPLGSTSLIFNFIFAYLLVGTPVTKLDVFGTIVIILGVVGVVVFGNHRLPSDFDAESNLSLTLLKQIWGRTDWIVYLVALEVSTIAVWWFSSITHQVCMARITDERGDDERDVSGIDAMVGGGGGRRLANPYEGQGFVGRLKGWRDGVKRTQGRLRKKVRGLVERWSQSRPDTSIRKLAGLCWSVTGGMLSGQTLVLAKSAVKLVTSAITKSDPNQSNQFTSPLTWLIVILLVVCAVSQVYCLNQGLKCFDSTFTVPIFFSVYSICGFLNSLVYLDETHLYKLWVFLCIWASIAVLILGVIMLSVKKPPKVVRPRSGSCASQRDLDQNPFDDSVELGSPVKPAFSRATMADGDLEAAKEEAEAPPLKRGQGWLGRLFGGLPDGAAAVPLVSSSLATARRGSEASQSQRRRQKGRQRLDDEDDGGGDSVLASERTSQPADDLELDEVDNLSKYAGYDSGRGEEDDDDFGEFEKATGAVRVEDDAERRTSPDSSAR